MEVFLFFLWVLIADAWGDWHRIEIRKKFIRHFWETFLVSILYVSGFMIICISGHYSTPEVISNLPTLIIWPSLRWIFHDILLNLMRRKPFNYVAEPSEKASFMDRLISIYAERGFSQFALKFGFLGVSLFIAFIVSISNPFIYGYF